MPGVVFFWEGETLVVLAGIYGRVVDFVALSRDPLTVPPDDLPEIT